jgi:hypothetical protein
MNRQGSDSLAKNLVFHANFEMFIELFGSSDSAVETLLKAEDDIKMFHSFDLVMGGNSINSGSFCSAWQNA